jgi:hypothetical protein
MHKPASDFRSGKAAVEINSNCARDFFGASRIFGSFGFRED